MASFASAGRRGMADGSFTRSMMAAAARGLGLVAAAVAAGVLLLEVTEDTGGGGDSVPIEVATAETTTTTTNGVGPDTALRPPSQVQALVLNAARIEGAAGEVTSTLQAIGHPTLPPGNAPTQEETVIYYKPGFEREASQLAPEVSDAALTEPLPDPSPFAGTEEADLVVVIGTNYADS